jgi:nucleotide-binding universal stress UspA family protein
MEIGGRRIVMYSNILIATDLSRESDELVRCVTGLRALGCRTAHLVYGLDVDDIGAIRADVERIVRPEIEKQLSVLTQAGIDARGHFVVRPVLDHIERIAAEHACRLLVVGSRVHSLAGDIAAGSLAALLLTSSARPILMLRLQQPDPAAPPSCTHWPCTPATHLLYPTDFSENAAQAFAQVERFLTECPPETITLMHVQDRARIESHLKDRLSEFNATDRARLEALARRCATLAPAVRVELEMPYGHPAQEIISLVRTTAVSLVIMGTQGRGRLEEVFLGSVSHRVARHAPAPVLLIPAAAG